LAWQTPNHCHHYRSGGQMVHFRRQYCNGEVMCSSTEAAPSLGEPADARLLRGIRCTCSWARDEIIIISDPPRKFLPTHTHTLLHTPGCLAPSGSACAGRRVRHAQDKADEDGSVD